MKKSDLWRRACNAARTIMHESHAQEPEETARLGFDAGYRAARADLRVLLSQSKPFDPNEGGWTIGMIRKWLRPIC